ncbi:MAG: Crp/Fnr family transcriptional regulator [Spirochaetia bacterium]
MDIKHLLKACGMFKNDTEAESCLRLFDSLKYSVKKYHRGAIVMFRGDLYEHLFILAEGTLSAEMEDLKGRVLKVETLKAPDKIAPGILFAEDNHLPVTLKTVTETTILSLPKESVFAICRENRYFLLSLLRDAGNKIVFLAEKMRLIKFSSIREKIASYLLDQAERQGSNMVELKISKETMSELFGVARPSLSRVFSEMTDEGILRQEGRSVYILDRQELELLLEE